MSRFCRTGRVLLYLLIFLLCVLRPTAILAKTGDASNSAESVETSDDQPIPGAESTVDKRAGKKEEEPPLLFYGYWKRGLYIKNPAKHFELKIGGKLYADGGYISAADSLDANFSDLDGSSYLLRRLSVSFTGAAAESLDFKLEIDVANVQDIKDNWLQFPKLPMLKYMKFGHMKEPFSLEELSSSNYLPFMERALTSEVFTPGRNIGILVNPYTVKEERRLTGAFGWFLNTGSFSSVGEARNQIERANGYNFSARVSALPWIAWEGKEFFHLGFSYNHRNRTGPNSEPRIGFRTRPESRLTSHRLVDTGEIIASQSNQLSVEAALEKEAASLQGEFFNAFVNADEQLHFWGTYLQCTLFLTGEHRRYNPSDGTFSTIDPFESFEPLNGRWGALEAGVRYSYVNLNDLSVQGGREYNLTAGLNMYLQANARVMLNYIYANVKERGELEIHDEVAHILQTRFQIHF